MATRKINTVEEIRNLEGRVYVRWSNSFAKDAKRATHCATAHKQKQGYQLVKLIRLGKTAEFYAKYANMNLFTASTAGLSLVTKSREVEIMSHYWATSS